MDRKEEFLKPGERLDDLQNGYWMIQNPSLFCYGIDAVLLASYAKVKRGECAMDFCTGSGIVPILLKAKTNGEHFSGLEIQEYSAEMERSQIDGAQRAKALGINSEKELENMLYGKRSPR